MTMQTTIVAAAAFAATIERKALADVLARAGKVIEKRNSIPILSNVLLRASGDVVTVAATDLDMTLTETVDASECQPGAVTVNCDALAKALKGMKGATVRLAFVNERLSVTDCDSGANVRLATLGAADWPAALASEPACAFTLPAAQLVSDWSRIRSAVSNEETRYYLNGVFMHSARVGPVSYSPEYLEAGEERAQLRKTDAAELQAWGEMCEAPDAFEALPETVARRERIGELDALMDAERDRFREPDALRMVATDGHRLGIITRPLPAGAAPLPDIIVPRKTVANVLAWLGKKAAGDVSMDVRKGQYSHFTRIRADRWELVSKTIEGTFPDYSRVVPSANDKRLTVDSAALIAAIDGATSVCNSKCRAVCLSFHPDYLVASATDPENGQAANIVEGASHDGGEAWAIGFNAAYLKDALSTLPGKAVAMLADEAAPTLFECADAPELRWVVMPMRVNNGTVWSRETVERLNMDPAQLFQADAPGYFETLAKPEMAAGTEAGKHVRPLIYQKLAALIAAYRAHLLACGGEPQRVHYVLAAVCAAMGGDTARETRARLVLASLGGERPAPVTVEPLTAPETATEPEIDEAAAAEAEGLVILGEVEAAEVAADEAPTVPETVPDYAPDYAEPAPFEPVPADQLEDDGDVTVYCSPPTIAAPIDAPSDEPAKIIEAPAPDLIETVARLAAMVAELQRQVATVAGGANPADLAEARDDAENMRAALQDMTRIAERAEERAELAETERNALRAELAAVRVELASTERLFTGANDERQRHRSRRRLALLKLREARQNERDAKRDRNGALARLDEALEQASAADRKATNASHELQRMRLAAGFGRIGSFTPWQGNHPANARVRLAVSNG